MRELVIAEELHIDLESAVFSFGLVGDLSMIKANDESDPEVEPRPSLEEGRDYYLEHGLMVFTEAYLLKRGFCCESGCRHCPYGYVKPDGFGPADER